MFSSTSATFVTPIGNTHGNTASNTASNTLSNVHSNAVNDAVSDCNKVSDTLGNASGDEDGDTPGDKDGDTPGDTPGDKDGDKDGDTLGDKDGDKNGDTPGDTPGDKDGDKDGDTLGDKDDDEDDYDLSIVNRITKTFKKNGSINMSKSDLKGDEIIHLVEEVINKNPTKLLCLNLANNKFSSSEIFKLTLLLKKCSSLLDFDMTNTKLNYDTLTSIVSALPTTLQHLKIGQYDISEEDTTTSQNRTQQHLRRGHNNISK